MDGGDHRLRRRRSLQERLGLACCGSTWGIGPSNMSIHNSDEDNDLVDVDPLTLTEVIRTLPESNSDPDCVSASPRMNLAAALAAERQSRSTVYGGEALTGEIENDDHDALTPILQNDENTTTCTTRVSLMRLLEETDDQDEKEGMGSGRDLVCCVCMGRKKGAAFIPCGHTFCRVCSRELWLNRGSCPLCNRSILEVLDIF